MFRTGANKPHFMLPLFKGFRQFKTTLFVYWQVHLCETLKTHSVSIRSSMQLFGYIKAVRQIPGLGAYVETHFQRFLFVEQIFHTPRFIKAFR